ncbi:MAG TPA: response regulator, partial [Chthoniobacterales bacterium]|nr:response regulator [Chthoniobacterales bacterium]
LGLADVIPLECLADANLVLRLQSHDKQGGEVHLFGGQITHAATTGARGPEALREMLGWRRPQFKIDERPADAPRSIQGPWSAILIEQLRYALETKSAETALPSIPLSTAKKNGKTILVIDDTEMLLIFVEDILATAQPDFQITTASNGTEGLREAEAKQPDLILMDYSLPDLNGDQVCERLLQRETTSALPVVMMSGHVLEMEAAARRLENIVATIAKPFFSAELLALVQETLARPRRKPRVVQPAVQLSEEKKRDPKAKVETSASVSTRNKKPASPATVAPVPMLKERVPPEAAAPVWIPPATATSTPVPATAPTAIKVVLPEQSFPLSEPPVILPPAAPSLPREPPPSVPASRTGRPVTPASVTAGRESEVLLGLPLEVISMEFTSALKIGAIRARPSSRVVALHLRSPALRERLNGGSDFELVSVDLDAEGRVETVRLSPARQQVEPFLTGAKLQVADVFVPRSSEARVHLTPTAVAPMRMQLRARLELTGVELSPTFQLAQLILKATGESVRVSLDSNAGENEGAIFQSATVRLDSDAQIAEILLDPNA